MNLPPPSTPAIRTVQQYRRRDIVPYLALRYYLDNRASRRARWAEDVSVFLACQSGQPAYFRAKHFKDRGADGTIGHRDLYLPGANEALAEGVLLAECSKHAAFQNVPAVFSYELARGDESDGIFRHYFHGLRRRHVAMASACRAFASPIVRYSDIQTFYPSVSPEVAERAWDQACAVSTLPTALVKLGRCLLTRQFSVKPRGRRELLTGPMFSHLIGSLVLRGIDQAMSAKSNIRYFRYVDDIVLVGPSSAVDAAHQEIGGRLQDIGLQLHPPQSAKQLVVDGEKWLEGEFDFHESQDPIQWKTLVGAMKWLLTGAPERRAEIQSAFRAEGFRLPFADYSESVRETGYLSRLAPLTNLVWFVKRRRGLRDLLVLAAELKKRYSRETENLLSQLTSSDAYDRKRLLPKLRYRAGRLAYLADRQQLASLAEELGMVPELHFHAIVLGAIATGDATVAIRLGLNAAQAAAQPLHAEGRSATFQGPPTSAIDLRGLAVLALNGVSVTGSDADASADEFLRLAKHGVTLDLMHSEDSFIREFASLHGLSDRPRHPTMLTSAFHAAEDAVFDAVGQMVFSHSDG